MAIDVSIETKIIDVSEENLAVDEEARKFQKESWPVRREAFKRNRASETTFAETKASKWLDIVKATAESENSKPLLVLIDGMFAHNAAVYFAEKYIDYKKFKSTFENLAETIYYFSANQESDKIAKFLNYIRSIAGCQVIIKDVPKIDKKLAHSTFKSIAVDMTVVALRETYEDINLRHVLILCRDPEIIPLVKELKDLELKVALARSSDIPTTRALQAEAEYILDIYDLFETLDCYSDTIVKPKEKDQTEN
jgi:uncharacterized LabA/DUF88 family protein